MKLNFKLIIFILSIWILSQNTLFAQGKLHWMRIGELYQYFSEQGSDFEGGRSSRAYVTQSDGMIWPGDYGEIQQTNCAHGFWLGARNVYHPDEDKTYDVRVVGRGPRNHTGWEFEIFPVEHKMIARSRRPNVYINDKIASDLDEWEDIDGGYDEDLPCDRMIITKLNTIIGVSVTKKILAWGNPDYDDFFIYDYTFKNTGIYDEKGSVYEQEIQDLRIASLFRYAFSGESVTGYDQGWGEWDTSWGRNTIYHCIGEDPSDPGFDVRAIYAWYGPESVRGIWDYGCPNDVADPTDATLDEHMAAAKYAGAITLHADTAPGDTTDDLTQPVTTTYLDSDDDIFQAVTASNEPVMRDRYDFMASGHPTLSMWEEMTDNGYEFVDEYIPNLLGGVDQCLGYGPYTLQPGDSIRIVIAEGVKGLSREKNREVTTNWLLHYTGEGSPTLTLPNGDTTGVTPDEYIKAWVQTCEDSILKTLRAAKNIFDRNYDIPKAPPPPNNFYVSGGGDRINLEWDTNAEGFTNDQGYSFDGYEIGRATNNINNTETKYTKVFECDASGAVSAWGDTNVIGNDYYYYYIVTRATNSSGNTIRSSKFFTLTNISGSGAQLVRPAGTNLSQIRVVPNPFVISQDENNQFPLPDEIRFYDIPGHCKIKVFTERGDLVWEFDHTDTSGKTKWVSLTMSGQTITSGIYIAYFEVTQDPPQDGDEEYEYKKGDHTYRKFMVIR